MMARPQRPLSERVAALREAATLSQGRTDDELIAQASEVVDHVDRRLAFSSDRTIIALAGATGSGKSSLFNAISGTELAEPGVRRPTTSRAMAATWGDDPPSELLDWLEVPRRHVVGPQTTTELDGLILLDLPDHDSTELSHRHEVDRLVKLVDMMIWVVDPQKYADAALHERYLRPHASHAEVIMVVLNQIDRLTPQQAEECATDLRKLLDAHGLAKARIAKVSATTGQGVDTLRSQMAAMIKAKKMAAARLSADVARVAGMLDEALGSGGASEVSHPKAKQLIKTLSAAACTDVVAEAVLGATRRRGRLATGWPALSWIASLRPDPLRRLHLDVITGKRRTAIEPARVQRSGLPTGATVTSSRVDSALRALSDEVSEGLPRGWADAVRAASLSHRDELNDELDRAVSTTDLAMDRGFGYWKVFQITQWVLITGVVLALLWLGVDLVLAYFQLPALPMRRWRRIPYPSLVIILGVLAGLLLAGIGRLLVEATARAKGRRAQAVLSRSISRVAQKRIIDPVNDELDRYQKARSAAAIAR